MKRSLSRRETLQLAGAAVAVGAVGFTRSSLAAAEPKMVVVHKIAGVPWVNLMKKGVIEGGKAYNIDATLIGPATADPALQAKLVEDVIAQRVAVLGVAPLDSNVLSPLLKRAHDQGIKVITLEGPNQPNRDWDVSMIDPIVFGETIMKQLAEGMGEKGQYVVIVGGLTTPLHKEWADAAVAYQKQHYPNMSQATDRFGSGESTDETRKVVLDVMKAHPKVTGFWIAGAAGPIGAGNALRQLRDRNATVVGTCTAGQAQLLIQQGWIKECDLWNPIESGYAMVAVARVLLDGKEMKSGMVIPGVGQADIVHNATGGIVELHKMLEVTKDNVAKYVADGL